MPVEIDRYLFRVICCTEACEFFSWKSSARGIYIIRWKISVAIFLASYVFLSPLGIPQSRMALKVFELLLCWHLEACLFNVRTNSMALRPNHKSVDSSITYSFYPTRNQCGNNSWFGDTTTTTMFAILHNNITVCSIPREFQR